MSNVSLSLSIIDSYTLILKQSWIALVAGLSIAFYMGYIEISQLIIVVPTILGSFLIAALMVSFIDKSHLTPNGIVHQNWRGKDNLLPWDAKIDAELLKSGYPGFVKVSSEGMDKPMHIFGKKLQENSVSEYVRKYSPEGHKLREFINNGS